jgi:hypothetical protein
MRTSPADLSPLLLAAASLAVLQELLLLLPDLASLLPSLHPRTLALLGSDTQGVAQKLVRGAVLCTVLAVHLCELHVKCTCSFINAVHGRSWCVT